MSDLIPDDDQPPSPETLAAVAATIDAWAESERNENPVVVAVERGEPGEGRWYIRVLGEEKDTFAIWLTLRQRMLHYETYVMPAPEENQGALFEHLLVRNDKIVGAAFCIGIEEAVFLKGAIPVHTVDHAALDHILGLLYATVEQCFRPALRIGFASRFSD
ncbi:MAG: YbjN domain-containing protein [Acidimicrobiales bacterium]|nr:YbjN domain-containing protein [Acidimicrobiales bacterium]